MRTSKTSNSSRVRNNLPPRPDPFVNREEEIPLFRDWLTAPTLSKRLLVIHGVGGVGKSALLRMFHLHCKSVRVPVALASGDEAKSAVEILSNWADDLKDDRVTLSSFSKTFKHYGAIQAKVDEKVRKMQEARGKVMEAESRDFAKTLIETAVSVIPGVGPLASMLGGIGAEAFVDWLSNFLSKPDVDLLLDPAKKLTAGFLADIVQVADKTRIVLMLDSYEQMSALDNWTSHLAQRLHPNVIFVIAGRTVPNWGEWHGWLAYAQVAELKPMSEENMRTLVRRYYATIRGGEPAPKQVEAIIAFSRGLPMVATSAVRLWTQYGVEDFQEVKTELVSDLVDRLLVGVPQEMWPGLEAASMLPWFNEESLRTFTGQADVSSVYNELRRFPFVRSRAEGLALHDAVREMIREYVRLHTEPQQYQTLLEHAIIYYRATIAKIEEYKGALDLSGEIDAREKTLRDALGDAAFELGLLYSKQDRWYDALRLLEESLAIRRQNDNLRTRADTIYQIARVHHLMGNLDKARIHYRDALRLYQHTENPQGVAACETGLGRLMIQMGFVDDAVRELDSAKRIYRQLGDNRRIAEVEEVLQVANHIKERQPA